MAIDVGTTALLLLDLQNEMVDPKGKVGSGGLARMVEERGVLTNAARALETARKAGMTVVHVRLGFRADYADALSVAPRVTRMKEHKVAVLGTWGTELHASVAPRDDELVITKQCVNPFFNTGLLTFLLRRGIKHVVLAGVATNLVVEASARFCDDAGFAITILEDCCASPNIDWHKFAIGNILPLFANISSTADWVASV